MSLFSKLFSGVGSAKAAELVTVEYNGFQIIAEPIAAEGGYRLAARIEAEVGGQSKSHHLIRADVISNRDDAVEAAISKAKQMIDEQGKQIFG